MIEGTALGPAVAFAAGLLSFLSPCVLPLVPSYLGFLTGMTLDEMGDRRRWALLHAFLFVSGFTVVFMALGAGATALGASLAYNRIWLARGGGVLLIVFGLYTLGVLRVGLFDTEQRVHFDRKPMGMLGSVLVGMAFAAGWTPCLGPILGGILTLGAQTNSLPEGMGLLGAYSAGLAVPFLLAAAAVDQFRTALQRFRRWMPWVQRVSGTLLLVAGILMVTGEFTRLSAALQAMTPDWLLQ
ncbi:MAG: cytochrome c biogenesis protein CcdA [Gemmatimonadales bacterium]